MKTFVIKFYFFNSKTQLVPFDYRQMLVSFLHKKILNKNNKYHDDVSLYTISPLFNSETTKEGLLFNEGAIWYIRTPHFEFFKDAFLKGKNALGSELGHGLFLKEINQQMEDFEGVDRLNIGASNIFLGQNPETEKRDHVTFKHDDNLSKSILKRIFLTKAKKINPNFNENDIEISFDRSKDMKTRAVKFGGGVNIVSDARLNIIGTPEALSIIYGVGVGLSTGIGFGYIYNIRKQ